MKATEQALIDEKKLNWIMDYIIEEGFSAKHIEALVKIVGLLNRCKESEREILEFADRLYQEYAA